MKLLLIGAGQLGSRHLQSLLKFKDSAEIYVVDKSIDSLELSKARAQEIESVENHKVFYLTELNDIECNELDCVVIATGASVRFAILKDVLAKFTVKYMILEKVLFQDMKSYQAALDIVKSLNVKVFVNCPLRVYPFFQSLKEQFISSENRTLVNYSGGEWIGLGCNTIHYLDLLNYLAEEKLIRVNVEELDDEIIESKRKGFKEFTGKLVAEFSNGSALKIHSIKNSEQVSVIEIINGDNRICIDELSGSYSVFRSNELVEESRYEVQYQSNLTHKMVEKLLDENDCGLIGFSESVELHEIYIEAMLSHYNRFTDKPELLLPIT